MLAVTAVGALVGLLPQAATLALALGAALIEVTTPVRRSMARQLAEAEQEIDELRRNG